MEYEAFRNSIQKVKGSRNYSVKNSLGVYDAYKYIRKNKWMNIGKPVTEKEFYAIIRSVNKLMAETLIQGNEIKLPCKMGTLELRKRNSVPYFNSEGKVVNTYAVNWDATIKLWYTDEEARAGKVLVRYIEKEVFKVHYNKTKACYNNQSFYEFRINRDIKRALTSNIKNNQIDAFIYGRRKY